MAEKAAKPFRVAPLQKGPVREITDPAEQAALDERIKRAQQAGRVVNAEDGLRDSVTVDSVLALCRRLSPEERLLLMSELKAQLPAEG
jgi:hypothetical protein